ncbi:MAG TPA: PA14 domain-containing protein, partial [Cyclobacteriaceae bacterium]
MRLLVLANIVFLATLFSCSQKLSYDKLDDGVIVHVKGVQARQIRLEVISENIIHVQATPEDSFSTEKSLVVLPESKQPTNWKLIEHDKDVVVATPALHAMVSLLTGEVSFTDTLGNPILREKQGGGKYFESAKVEELSCYHVRQVFESPDDEAFYGLGGHQNGQMNYKGQDVELAQHNIVDVIPFLYSSKNYGILWDNYSISKFGDPRDYLPLNSLKLFAADGKEGGLTASYYAGEKVVKNNVEDKIDYEFLETPQVDSFPKNITKVVWEGSFTSEAEGQHKFLVYASSYFKVWVDDNLIMDKWRQNWNPWSNKFSVDVKKGEKHKLKIEWIPNGGYLAVKHL